MQFDFLGFGGFYADCAEYMARQDPAAVAETLRLAEELCRNNFTFREHWEMERTHEPVHFEGEINWGCVPADDPEWLYAMNRHTSFVVLGRAWRYSGQEKYARCFVRLAESWLDAEPLREENKNTTWRSLECGIRPENWLRALVLFSGCEEVPQTLADKMQASLTVHRDYLLEASGTFQKLSNWGVLQDYGLLQIGLLLKDEATITTAMARLEGEMALQVFDDGSHWEQSPLYHCEVLHCFLGSWQVAERAGRHFSAAYRARLGKMATALAVWCKPGGVLPCQSDSDAVDARDLLAAAAVLLGQGSLKKYIGATLPPEAYWMVGRDGAAAYAALAAEPEPTMPATASVALPDSGNYFLRSDDGPTANWLHFHCGCLGSGHGHADQLHVDLAAHGRDILIDSGRYTYVDTPLRRALKQPAAHNTTRVDNRDFSECIDSWGYRTLAEPCKGSYKFTPEVDFLSGAHLGYLSGPGGVYTARKIVYIKPAVYLIADMFYPAGGKADHDPHCYEQNFHFAPEGKLKTEQETGNAAFYTPGAAAAVRFLGEGLEITQSEAPCSREYNRLETCPLLTVRCRAEGFCSMLTVIATGPEQQTELPLSARLLPVQLQKSGKILPPEKAQGVEICLGDRRWVVLLAHAEVISEVDLLQVGEYAGYGKTVIFDADHPAGLCLAW